MPHSVRKLALVALLFGFCDCARAADNFRRGSDGVPAQAGPLYLTLDVSMSGTRAAVTSQLLALKTAERCAIRSARVAPCEAATRPGDRHAAAV
jgi:hypothetical protein